MRNSPDFIRTATLGLLVFSATGIDLANGANPPATWTTGLKKVLVIPVRFTDQVGPSDAPGPGGYLSGWGNVTNGTTTAELTNFFARESYGKCNLQFTVLPEINMGVSYTNYNLPYGNSGVSKFTAWSDPGSFADDARARARQVGLSSGNAGLYDTDNYDLDIIAVGFIPNQGTLSSGLAHGKGVFGNSFKFWAHELSHNLGLQHGNGLSRSSYYAPLPNGSYFYDAYGDVYDLMGFKDTFPIPTPLDHDANVYWKNLLGWLPDSFVVNPAVSGTYRIYAFDQPALEAGKNYAMKIVRDPSHTYWYDFRQAITNTDAVWSQNGLEVRFGGDPFFASSGHTTLIDMTPGSRGPTNATHATMHDAPLAIGRTYSDAEINLHVTPIKKGGTTPDSLDVVVNFGPFPGNAAPTVSIFPTNVSLAAGVPQSFTATASDPDGDTLAYNWEFDDSAKPGGMESGGTNPDSRLCTQGVHTWTRNGDYLVRCKVTDMKGHTASAAAWVTVTGGTAGLLTISGTVRDENGNPLAGAIVNNYKGTAPTPVAYGATNFAGSGETAADGRYIVQLPAIGPQTYNLAVMYQGYAFYCSVAGGAIPVTTASVTNVNFTRIRTTRKISGGIYVAGRAYDPATDGALTVSAAGQTVNATLGSWQIIVADGTLANLTVTPPNSSYEIANFSPNPFMVVNDLSTLHFLVKIPGRMPEVGFLSAGTNSDDTVGTVNIPVTMTLPAGSNSWVADQFVYYWIDPSSTAEYGVDYKMSGGQMNFYANTIPVPRMIPLKIIHDGIPKNKTVVIRLGVGSSIANVGPNTTFTYSIANPLPVVAISASNQVINLSWPSTPLARYTVQSTPNLNPAVWNDVFPFTNLTGGTGSMTRSIPLPAGSNGFFRIKVL
jgi:hypothetical protein